MEKSEEKFINLNGQERNAIYKTIEQRTMSGYSRKIITEHEKQQVTTQCNQ